MNQYEVDRWVEENSPLDASDLLDEKLPKMRQKLNRLDKRIQDTLKEIRQVFPDAIYYTASGDFHLILGETHDGSRDPKPQRQRAAWHGHAEIGDGDW